MCVKSKLYSTTKDCTFITVSTHETLESVRCNVLHLIDAEYKTSIFIFLGKHLPQYPYSLAIFFDVRVRRNNNGDSIFFATYI